MDMNHSQHHPHHATAQTPWTEYVKFIGVIVFIVLVSYGLSAYQGFTADIFMRSFMGVFFVVFAIFKLLDLRGFVMSYIGYDIIARKIMRYAYVYPFIELALGLGYLFDVSYLDWITLPLVAIGAIGVGRELLRGAHIKCACLGTYIQLPLTTVSLVEDLLMGGMALWFLIQK